MKFENLIAINCIKIRVHCLAHVILMNDFVTMARKTKTNINFTEDKIFTRNKTLKL